MRWNKKNSELKEKKKILSRLMLKTLMTKTVYEEGTQKFIKKYKK